MAENSRAKDETHVTEKEQSVPEPANGRDLFPNGYKMASRKEYQKCGVCGTRWYANETLPCPRCAPRVSEIAREAAIQIDDLYPCMCGPERIDRECKCSPSTVEVAAIIERVISRASDPRQEGTGRKLFTRPFTECVVNYFRSHMSHRAAERAVFAFKSVVQEWIELNDMSTSEVEEMLAEELMPLSANTTTDSVSGVQDHGPVAQVVGGQVSPSGALEAARRFAEGLYALLNLGDHTRLPNTFIAVTTEQVAALLGSVEGTREREVAMPAGIPPTDTQAQSHREIHKTTPVQVWADVDEGIAKLVKLLNTIPGVRTDASCEGTERYEPYVMAHWPMELEGLLRSKFDVEKLGENWGYIRPRVKS